MSLSMRIQPSTRLTRPLAMVAICLVLTGQYVWAQNLGTAPALNTAVQGQTGAQPEGAFLNFINWIGNVIAPVAAGGAVVGGVVGWITCRGAGRWLAAGVSVFPVSLVT